jgi:NMD protein affecting ribosome stability and mRNA decay
MSNDHPPVLECLHCGSRWLVDIIGEACPRCGSRETKEGRPLPDNVEVSKCAHKRMEATQQPSQDAIRAFNEYHEKVVKYHDELKGLAEKIPKAEIYNPNIMSDRM